MLKDFLKNFNLSFKFYLKTFLIFILFSFFINYLFFYLPKFYDFPLTLHDAYSVYAYGLIETHNSVMWFILLILIFVYWILIQFLRESIWNTFYKKIGFLRILNVSDIYSFFEFFLILGYLKIWSIFFFFWRSASEFFFLSFFNKDFVELYTWVEWVPDIFRQVSDFFYADFFQFFIHFNKNTQLNDVIYFFYLERKILSTYCNNINNYYLYSKKMHKDLHLNLSFRHSGFLEFLFALFPSIIILLILIPSLHLLYASEDAIIEPEYTIKIIGHQWYWSYEFSHIFKNLNGDNIKFNFDITQNIKIESDLIKGEYRLLEVDNELKLPIGTPIRLLISSADVLHSWSLPAFGIKVDAVPGRLNAINTFIFAPGTFYGQCSELCGVGHGFMPIKIEAVSKEEFLKFIGLSKIENNFSKNNSLNFFIDELDDELHLNNFLKNNNFISDYYIDDINDYFLNVFLLEHKIKKFTFLIQYWRFYVDALNISWAKHALLRDACIDSLLFNSKDVLINLYNTFKNEYIPYKHLYNNKHNNEKLELPSLNNLNLLKKFLENQMYYDDKHHDDANFMISSLTSDQLFDKREVVKYINSYLFKDLNIQAPYLKTEYSKIIENKLKLQSSNSIDHIKINIISDEILTQNKADFWGAINYIYGGTGHTDCISVVLSNNLKLYLFANGTSKLVNLNDFNLNNYLKNSYNSINPKYLDNNLTIKGPDHLQFLFKNNLSYLKRFDLFNLHLNEYSKTIYLKDIKIAKYKSTIDKIKPDIYKYREDLIKERITLLKGSMGAINTVHTQEAIDLIEYFDNQIKNNAELFELIKKQELIKAEEKAQAESDRKNPYKNYYYNYHKMLNSYIPKPEDYLEDATEDYSEFYANLKKSQAKIAKSLEKIPDNPKYHRWHQLNKAYTEKYYAKKDDHDENDINI